MDADRSPGPGTFSVTLSVDDDATGSDSETFDVTVLTDGPTTVSIAGITDGNETGPVDGQFTVTQTAITAADTVIIYSVDGTAEAGSDYTDLSGIVTLTAGTTSARIPVLVIDDASGELTENVSITLTFITSSSPGVTVDGSADTATIDIMDDETLGVFDFGSVFTYPQTIAFQP